MAEFNPIKIRLLANEITPKTVKKPEGFSIEFFDDKIILNNQTYEKLFKSKLGESIQKHGDRGYVEIITSKGKFYRRFYGGSNLSVNADEVCLTSFSYQMMPGIDDLSWTKFTGYNDSSLKIKLKFYFNHPHYHVRFSVKLASLSVLLGFISFILSILSLTYQ